MLRKASVFVPQCEMNLLACHSVLSSPFELSGFGIYFLSSVSLRLYSVSLRLYSENVLFLNPLRYLLQ
jgi:hypothetical protein